MTTLAPSVQMGTQPISTEVAPAPKQLTDPNLTMGDLIDICQTFEQYKVDTQIHSSKLHVRENGTFTIEDHNNLHLTDHSLGQLCAQLGLPFYKRSLPSPYIGELIQQYPALVAPVLQAHAEGYDKDILVRLYHDQIRAILSNRYARIDNLTLLEKLQTLLDRPN